jgi:hypothetical protein
MEDEKNIGLVQLIESINDLSELIKLEECILKVINDRE